MKRSGTRACRLQIKLCSDSAVAKFHHDACSAGTRSPDRASPKSGKRAKRIAGTIVRTPLVRLELGPDFPDIRLKLENLQPINAYKLRGAANAVAMLSESERKLGVWTISAGNAGQGVAYAARKRGRAEHGRRHRDRAASEARADARARREADYGSVRSGVAGARGALLSGSRRHLCPSVRRSTISSPATRRWAWRFSKTRPTRPRSSPASAAAD